MQLMISSGHIYCVFNIIHHYKATRGHTRVPLMDLTTYYPNYLLGMAWPVVSHFLIFSNRHRATLINNVAYLLLVLCNL